jgi:hypothetical protein
MYTNWTKFTLVGFSFAIALELEESFGSCSMIQVDLNHSHLEKIWLKIFEEYFDPDWQIGRRLLNSHPHYCY